MRFVACLACGARTPMPDVLDRVRAGDPDPACTEPTGGTVCAGILKSATISFGQNLVVEDLVRSEEALGAATSSWPWVPPCRSTRPPARPTAHRAGARVVIVNGQPTEYDPIADVVVRGPISEVLPVIISS